MISFLLILLHLVQLCLSHLLIMLILRMMKLKLKQLVRTQIKSNLFQEHPLRLKRKRLETLGQKGKITKSLNKRSHISVITMELQRHSSKLLQVVSHSTKQQYALIWKPKSVSIISYPSWRSSQGPRVPFELKQFQFFPLTTGSKVHSKERFFQGVEGKRLKVIQSLFLSLPLRLCITCLFCFLVESVQFYDLYVSLCFCLVVFQFLLYFFFIKIKKKIEKLEKYKKQCVCVYWYLCTLDGY